MKRFWYSIYFRTVSYQLLLSSVYLFPVWSGMDILCTIHVALPKWPLNQFKLDHKSKQQALRDYYSDIYAVVFGLLLSFSTLYLGDPNLLVSCPDNYLSSLVITLWLNINILMELGSPDVTWVRMLHVLGRVYNIWPKK